MQKKKKIIISNNDKEEEIEEEENVESGTRAVEIHFSRKDFKNIKRI